MAVQIRSLMVKGSIWTATEDLEIESVDDGKWAWFDLLNPLPNGPKRECRQIHKEMKSIPKGASIKILNKMSTYSSGPGTGLYVPIEVDGKSQFWVTFGDLKDKVELTQAMVQREYRVYNPTLDKYLLLYDHSGYEGNTHMVDLTWTDKFSKAKKHKMLHQSRQYMLGFTGYYQGLAFEGDYIAEGIATGWPARDVPKDLVIHEHDKITKEKLAEYPLQPYFDNMFRLRPLTAKYGSPVRSVFKEIEEKKDEYSTLLMFKDSGDDTRSFEYEVSPKIVSLKEDFKALKLARGSYLMKSNNSTVAFAFKDRGDAVRFRLTYSGDLSSQLVDAETLNEVSAA